MLSPFPAGHFISGARRENHSIIKDEKVKLQEGVNFSELRKLMGQIISY